MKIENEGSATNLTLIQHDVHDREKSVKTESTKYSADTVHLSQEALDYGKIKDVLETVSEKGADKAAQIADSLQNNTYNVDSSAVAEKLINTPVIDIIL